VISIAGQHDRCRDSETAIRQLLGMSSMSSERLAPQLAPTMIDVGLGRTGPPTTTPKPACPTSDDEDATPTDRPTAVAVLARRGRR
jgi:hypothetical protein